MTTSQSQSRIASRSGRNALGVGAHGGLEEPNLVRAGAEGLDKPAPQQELSSSPAEEKPKWEKRELRWKQRSPYNGCDSCCAAVRCPPARANLPPAGAVKRR